MSCAVGRRNRRNEKGPREGPFSDQRGWGDQPPTTAKAAATDEPMARISAGAIWSKNRSKRERDITHTFELELPSFPWNTRGSGSICYLNSDKISIHLSGVKISLRRLDREIE